MMDDPPGCWTVGKSSFLRDDRLDERLQRSLRDECVVYREADEGEAPMRLCDR
jgi:hypothetical protein